MAVVYHWKHGWIPLDHTAALSKAKGNHELAAKMLADAKTSQAGIHTKQDVAKAALAVPKIEHEGDRRDAMRQVREAAVHHDVTVPGHISNADKIRNADAQVSVSPTMVTGQHYYATRRGQKMVNGRRRDVWAIRERGTDRNYGTVVGQDEAVKRVQLEDGNHERNAAALADKSGTTNSSRPPARSIDSSSKSATTRPGGATDRQVNAAMTLLASALRSGALDLDGYDYERLRRMSRSQISAFITRLREQY